MITSSIQKQLFQVTPIEQEQINNNGKNVQDVPTSPENIEDSIARMPFWHFFDQGRIAVTQSNRFSYIPAHKHKFIEMNYCYQGRSIQYIDDKLITLTPGNLIIMDREIQQRINYARRQDILVNILIRDDYEINDLTSNLHDKNNLLVSFLINCTKRNFPHNNYLVLDLNKDLVFKNIIEDIINKGLNNDGSNNQLLKYLLQSFICAPNALIKSQKINFSSIDEKSLYPVINYMNDNFKDITLRELADKFGYNKNYLGNKISKETNHTFKELLQMRKLNIACNLLQSTNLNMDQISEHVGYDNHSSLFRLFKSYLKITPTEYRKRIRLPKSLDGDSLIPNPYFSEN